MDIPHSSNVVVGKRVPFWRRPDWLSADGVLVILAPFLIVGVAAWEVIHFKAGHLFDDGAIGKTLIGVPLGLILIAIGIGILYSTFVADRSIEAPCPICGGDRSRWTPGERSTKCYRCDRYLEVDADGSIRELPLDSTREFSVSVDRWTFADAVASDGHVTLVTPTICAVCGAEPTKTGAVRDEGLYDSARKEAAEPVRMQTRRDLLALQVPLCAAHADQSPLWVAELGIDELKIRSYRFYRAFMLANLGPARSNAVARQAAQTVARDDQSAVTAAVSPRAISGQLAPLLCENCGAPLPVGAGDETTCFSCGHNAALPEAYKRLRESRQLSEKDAAELRELAAEVAKPPPAWQRTAMIVGYIVGGATVAVMALGAVIGAVGGLVVGDKLGETAAKFCAVVGAVGIGIVSVPFAGEWVAAVATLHHTSLAIDIATSRSTQLHYDLIAAVLLYGLGVVPLSLAIRTQGKLDGIVTLQRQLAARRSTLPGAGLCCRNCGAALDASSDALVSRCIYCGADNLLSVPAADAKAEADAAKKLHGSVAEAVAQRARERSDDRANTVGFMLLGLLLVPVVCGAGYLLHRVVLA